MIAEPAVPVAGGGGRGELDAVLADQRLVATARRVVGRASLHPFHSDPGRTLAPGDLYLVGLNPGGPVTQPSQPTDGDERWPGSSRERVAALARAVLPGGEQALEAAFFTSALLARGPAADLEAADLDALWAVCAPWHARWLARVRPRAVLCLGNRRRGPGRGERSPFDWFARLLDAPRELPPRPLYRGLEVTARAGRLGGRETLVLGVPPPGQWDPEHERAADGVRHARALLRRSVLAAR